MASAVGGGSEENDGIGSNDKQKLEAEVKVFQKRKHVKGVNSGGKKRVRAQLSQLQSGQLGAEDENMLRESEFSVMSGDSSGQKRKRDVSAGNVVAKEGFLKPESRVSISLSTKSKEEARDLKRRLESELNEIRNLVRKMEEKEVRVSGNVGRGVGGGKKSKQGPSVVDSVGVPRAKSLNQLSVPAVESYPGATYITDKDKRLPKANKFYKNADFLLAKDKIPQMESNKKPKTTAGNGKKGGGGEPRDVPGLVKFSGRVMKSCTSLLDRLMKHKHGWVFNKPVDTVGLGLQDYFDVIKTPMDLGTVKSRLSTNWYKSAKEFAEDVRLTFHNAMTYNPRGQDVYLMAEELSGIFENKWAAIEADYIRDLMLKKDNEVELPVPKSKKPTPALIPPPETRTLGRPESMILPADAKPPSLAHSVRTLSSKKPKARDPDKRDMTYDEKQKLSSDLQNLPSEKLENVVQIIRKRNPSLFQNDDEIEVDIDSVDTETLWELDRFVANFKKSVSKSKRQADLANQQKEETVKNDEEKSDTPAALGIQKASQSEGEDISSSHAEAEAEAETEAEAKPMGSSGSRSSKSSGSDANSESESGSSSGGGSDI